MKFFSCFQRYERIILLRRKWLPERLRLFTAIHNNRPIAYGGPHVKFRGGPHLPLPRHWLHLWFTCACVFCFSWEFGNVCYWKGFWGKSSNCFRREKMPNCGNVDNKLYNKLNISGIFLLSLSPHASGKWPSSVWMTCLKIWNFFWEGRAVA